MKALDGAAQEPHVFILDINGEYAKAFPATVAETRLPDRIYLNGKEFSLPLWFLNAEEICAWLSASEQTQEPAETGGSTGKDKLISMLEALAERVEARAHS